MIHKASAIVLISFAVTVLLLLMLMIVDTMEFMSGAYETFSATATVGLSRNLTPNLNTAGRWVIIIAMYLGRIGPISMGLFFNYNSQDKNKVSYADGNFYIG
jgi:trk system potassium uptake protein TrkH